MWQTFGLKLCSFKFPHGSSLRPRSSVSVPHFDVSHTWRWWWCPEMLLPVSPCQPPCVPVSPPAELPLCRLLDYHIPPPLPPTRAGNSRWLERRGGWHNITNRNRPNIQPYIQHLGHYSHTFNPAVKFFSGLIHSYSQKHLASPIHSTGLVWSIQRAHSFFHSIILCIPFKLSFLLLDANNGPYHNIL